MAADDTRLRLMMFPFLVEVFVAADAVQVFLELPALTIDVNVLLCLFHADN